MPNVYLVPTEEATYKGVISDREPENGIFVTEEGTYPVKVKYKRHNEKMKEESRNFIAGNMYELLEWLSFVGATRNTITAIWHHKSDTASEGLKVLFNRCTARKAEIFREEYGTK